MKYRIEDDVNFSLTDKASVVIEIDSMDGEHTETTAIPLEELVKVTKLLVAENEEKQS